MSGRSDIKWFKHISDSLDDPFIFDLVENFGHSGYVVFFGTIEIYAREFEPNEDYFLTISLKLLRQKLQFAHATRLKVILKYIESSGKWNINFRGKKVLIHIPKFFNFLDESTLKKLREKRESSRIHSGSIPEEFLPIDADADVDIDNTKVLSENSPKKPPAKKKPAPQKKPASQAPPANNHFSFKVGDQVEKIKRHCRDIEKHPQANGLNPWQWVTQKTKTGGHPLAISGSLEWLLVCLNGNEPVENPYGLLEKTFKTKNPKFNERQEIEDSKAFKTNKADAKAEFNKLWAKVC